MLRVPPNSILQEALYKYNTLQLSKEPINGPQEKSRDIQGEWETDLQGKYDLER